MQKKTAIEKQLGNIQSMKLRLLFEGGFYLQIFQLNFGFYSRKHICITSLLQRNTSLHRFIFPITLDTIIVSLLLFLYYFLLSLYLLKLPYIFLFLCDFLQQISFLKKVWPVWLYIGYTFNINNAFDLNILSSDILESWCSCKMSSEFQRLLSRK